MSEMEITQANTSQSCPEGIPYFLEQTFLDEAADLCSLNKDARICFMREAADIRQSRRL